MSSQMACQRHANWQKNSSKVRDKWQRKVLGMPIYGAFGSQLFLLPRIYVPYGNIVFHGVGIWQNGHSIAWKRGGLQQRSNCRTEHKDANIGIHLLAENFAKLWLLDTRSLSVTAACSKISYLKDY
jgi:hypothetical protein